MKSYRLDHKQHRIQFDALEEDATNYNGSELKIVINLRFLVFSEIEDPEQEGEFLVKKTTSFWLLNNKLSLNLYQKFDALVRNLDFTQLDDDFTTILSESEWFNFLKLLKTLVKNVIPSNLNDEKSLENICEYLSFLEGK